MNNNETEQFEEQLDKVLCDDSNKEATEKLIKHSRKSLNIIELISLGFYVPNLILYIIKALENSKLYGPSVFKTIVQMIIVYLMLEYVKKGHKNIAIIPLIGSLASFIYVSKIFELSKYNEFAVVIGMYALFVAVFGSLSMAYIVFDSNIKKYCEYMKNNK